MFGNSIAKLQQLTEGCGAPTHMGHGNQIWMQLEQEEGGLWLSHVKQAIWYSHHLDGFRLRWKAWPLDQGKITQVQEVCNENNICASITSWERLEETGGNPVLLMIAEVVGLTFSFQDVTHSNKKQAGGEAGYAENYQGIKYWINSWEGIGSKSAESSSSYFLVIKDLFQTRRCSQASNTPLRNIGRQVGRSWPGKRCPETNETNLLAQKIWRPGELGRRMLPSFQKLQVHSVCPSIILHYWIMAGLLQISFTMRKVEDVGGALWKAFQSD